MYNALWTAYPSMLHPQPLYRAPEKTVHRPDRPTPAQDIQAYWSETCTPVRTWRGNITNAIRPCKTVCHMVIHLSIRFLKTVFSIYLFKIICTQLNTHSFRHTHTHTHTHIQQKIPPLLSCNHPSERHSSQSRGPHAPLSRQYFSETRDDTATCKQQSSSIQWYPLLCGRDMGVIVFLKLSFQGMTGETLLEEMQ